jgi:hypothetical protein
MKRLAGLIALGITLIAVTFGAVTTWATVPDVCPDETVFYEDGCVFRDSLGVLLEDGQTRAGLEAAIAPYGGQFDVAIDIAGIYSIRFPVRSIHELQEIMWALQAAGYPAHFQIPGELFAGHEERNAALVALDSAQ